MTWFLVIAAYLIGAIPTSYIAARALKGIDLRTVGSGNLGATNAYRVLGWKAAVPIFIIDIGKGWFPVAFFPSWDAGRSEWALAYGTAAILGHVFSPYVGFRGGKGVATGAGVFLAMVPFAVAVGLLIWATLVATTGYVSLASIVSAAALPLVILVIRGNDAVFWYAVAVAAFVVYAHRANISRLLRGEEHRFRRRAGAST